MKSERFRLLVLIGWMLVCGIWKNWTCTHTITYNDAVNKHKLKGKRHLSHSEVTERTDTLPKQDVLWTYISSNYWPENRPYIWWYYLIVIINSQKILQHLIKYDLIIIRNRLHVIFIHFFFPSDSLYDCSWWYTRDIHGVHRYSRSPN